MKMKSGGDQTFDVTHMYKKIKNFFTF